MYNVQQIDPDVRWHQEPIVDIIFVSDLIDVEIIFSYLIFLVSWFSWFSI
jgi:hypothetical protein